MIRAYDDNGNVVDLVKWENEIYNKAVEDFINYAYVKGIDFSFMGRITENGKSDVPVRLKKIKDDFFRTEERSRIMSAYGITSNICSVTKTSKDTLVLKPANKYIGTELNDNKLSKLYGLYSALLMVQYEEDLKEGKEE